MECIILGPHGMSVERNKYSHYSNSIVENWMRIIKIDILSSKCNLKPGDFIRTVFEGQWNCCYQICFTS